MDQEMTRRVEAGTCRGFRLTCFFQHLGPPGSIEGELEFLDDVDVQTIQTFLDASRDLHAPKEVVLLTNHRRLVCHFVSIVDDCRIAVFDSGSIEPTP
jgi:hypothetical protein